MAAPVFNLNQQVIAALGVTSSLKRFTKNRIPALAKIVVGAAQKLSEHLGASTS